MLQYGWNYLYLHQRARDRDNDFVSDYNANVSNPEFVFYCIQRLKLLISDILFASTFEHRSSSSTMLLKVTRLNDDLDLNVNNDLNDDFVNDDFDFNVIDLNDLYIVAVWMEPSLSTCSIAR